MDMVNGLLVMDDGLHTRYLMRLSDVNLCNRHVQRRTGATPPCCGHNIGFPLTQEIRSLPVRKVVQFVLHMCNAGAVFGAAEKDYCSRRQTSVIHVWWFSVTLMFV